MGNIMRNELWYLRNAFNHFLACILRGLRTGSDIDFCIPQMWCCEHVCLKNNRQKPTMWAYKTRPVTRDTCTMLLFGAFLIVVVPKSYYDFTK